MIRPLTPRPTVSLLPVGLPGDTLEKCSTPNSGGSGGEHRHVPETMASTSTTTTTGASSSRRSSPSPSTSKHQHLQHQPGRRAARGGVGGGGGGATGGFTSCGSGTSATVFNSVADPAEDHQCSLRGLVWKVLLGTIHTDAMLYIRLVEKGPSSEDFKIRNDTFRTFPRDEEFRRRVHEHKLSRINNAFVRLNRPVSGRGDAAVVSTSTAERRGSGDRGRDGERGSSGGGNNNSDGDGDGDGCGDEQQPEESDGFCGSSSSAALDGPGAEAGLGSGGGGGGGGDASGGGGSGGTVAEVAKGDGGVVDRGKGLYVQGMMVLCAPLLFVMPEVDAFFCFNSLLNQHMPR